MAPTSALGPSLTLENLGVPVAFYTQFKRCVFFQKSPQRPQSYANVSTKPTQGGPRLLPRRPKRLPDNSQRSLGPSILTSFLLLSHPFKRSYRPNASQASSQNPKSIENVSKNDAESLRNRSQTILVNTSK